MTGATFVDGLPLDVGSVKEKCPAWDIEKPGAIVRRGVAIKASPGDEATTKTGVSEATMRDGLPRAAGWLGTRPPSW